MKKIIILLSSLFLLVGCIESIALISGGATNGKIVQSSLKSAVSFGVKKQTGKSPMQHALAYAEEKNPNKKKEKCISFIKKTNSEACMIINKQIALAQTTIVKKVSSTKTKVINKITSTQNFVTEKKQVVPEKAFEVENETNYRTKYKKSAIKIVSVVQAKIKEYDARWLDRIVKSRSRYSD